MAEDYNYDDLVNNYPSGVGTPGGRGGGGIGRFADFALGGIGGGLSNFFKGRQHARDQENDFNARAQSWRLTNPNAALDSARQRNYRSNMYENMAGLLPNGGQGMKPQDITRGLTNSMLQSMTSGINPMLIQEGKNIAGVPGLQVGGQYVGQDPSEMFKAKKPGFLESLGSGFAGILGGG